MNLSFRRAEVLSVVALLLHVLFFLLTFWISAYANSLGCLGEAWHFMGGVFIWVLLILQFRQRRLAQEEQLDVEQFQRLRSEGKDTSLFEGKQIEGTLHIASRRLVWLEKYLIAIFAVLLSVFLIFIGYMQFRTVQTMELAPMAGREKLLVMAAYLAGVALVSFLFSRYAVGMSQQGPWRPLRAGGSYLLSNALVCFALAVMMLIPDKGDRSGDKILGYVLSGVMLFIGAETLLNLILDAYRPRIKGQYRRAPYESRLLGLISEPEGIFKTAAQAVDFLFGF
jgi:hypothetical protein